MITNYPRPYRRFLSCSTRTDLEIVISKFAELWLVGQELPKMGTKCNIARISRRLMRFWDRDLTVPNAFFDCCFTAVTRLKGATVANPQWLRPQHVERSTQLNKHSA